MVSGRNLLPFVCFATFMMAACGGDDSSDSSNDQDASDQSDGQGGSDSQNGSDAGVGPGVEDAGDGTRYPVPPTTGVVDGTFVERLGAAFDGVDSQTAAESAVTPLFEGEAEEFLLYREFSCPMRLQRVEVIPPSDGPFVFDETYYPNGGSGELRIVGRRPWSTYWDTITTVPYTADSPIVVLPEALTNATDYAGFGIMFDSSEPVPGQIRVAEIKMFGFCTGPEWTIEWDVPEFVCSGVECVSESNPGGTQQRDVRCLRDDDSEANEQFCAVPKPAETGEACELQCPHELVYVGPRAFTYDNDSGWLHEGSDNFRAGPLPSEIEYGTTVDAIEGAPCSVLTTNPAAVFMAISCVESSGEGIETTYCSFRCE